MYAKIMNKSSPWDNIEPLKHTSHFISLPTTIGWKREHVHILGLSTNQSLLFVTEMNSLCDYSKFSCVNLYDLALQYSNNI